MKSGIIRGWVVRSLLAAALLFAPVQLAHVAQAQSADEVAALIAEAEKLRTRAAELEYEWRFTGKRIKEAKTALKNGDLQTALAKAERAKFEAERAIEQAAISEKTWEIAVPR